MIFNNTIYIVYLDGLLAGICEDEDCVWDIAQNCVNGTPYPLTDDNFPDRVWYEIINVNRWKICDKAVKCVEDKYTGKSILCSTTTEAENAVDILNHVDLEREREEAKLRAMVL